MKLATFTTSDDAAPRAGEVRDDTIVAFDDGLSVLDRLRSGDRSPASGPSFPLADVTLLAPHVPRAIFCIGWNYKAHIEETGRELPEFPVVFLKLPASAAPPNGVVTCPKAIRRLDYEVELTIVMGPGGEIAGYTVADDVSGRDLQKREPQWTRAKGADTFCPFGPWITTADEVGDPTDLDMRLWVVRPDGSEELRQHANTGDLVLDLPGMVAMASAVMTLEPGDIIATGTPAGVGPVEDGDRVRISIERVGEMTVDVVQGTSGRTEVFANPYKTDIVKQPLVAAEEKA